MYKYELKRRGPHAASYVTVDATVCSPLILARSGLRGMGMPRQPTLGPVSATAEGQVVRTTYSPQEALRSIAARRSTWRRVRPAAVPPCHRAAVALAARSLACLLRSAQWRPRRANGLSRSDPSSAACAASPAWRRLADWLAAGLLA